MITMESDKLAIERVARGCPALHGYLIELLSRPSMWGRGEVDRMLRTLATAAEAGRGKVVDRAVRRAGCLADHAAGWAHEVLAGSGVPQDLVEAMHAAQRLKLRGDRYDVLEEVYEAIVAIDTSEADYELSRALHDGAWAVRAAYLATAYALEAVTRNHDGEEREAGEAAAAAGKHAARVAVTDLRPQLGPAVTALHELVKAPAA